FCSFHPSRISLPRKGCRVGLRIVLFEDCSAFTRVTACTLALSPIRDTLSEGFSYFVTSIAAPAASGWSIRRVGFAPTGKHRLVTAHTHFTDVAESQPELLARHCTEAGLIEKAATLWGKAGQGSLERSALAEAVDQLTRALDQIATLPATPALRRQQIKLQVALITPLIHVKGYAASKTKAAVERARLLIEQAEALGEPPDDPLLLFAVLGLLPLLRTKATRYAVLPNNSWRFKTKWNLSDHARSSPSGHVVGAHRRSDARTSAP